MTILQAVLTLALFGVGLALALLAGVILRVAWTLARRGPALATVAYERGEDLDSWIDPSKNKPFATSGLEVRHGLAVRFDRT